MLPCRAAPLAASAIRHQYPYRQVLKEWMARDLSGLGLLVIQIDGIHREPNSYPVGPHGVRNISPPRCNATNISLSICFYWCRNDDSNTEPPHYE
jgi:hypothetical protein